jgi:hypothetical protein
MRTWKIKVWDCEYVTIVTIKATLCRKIDEHTILVGDENIKITFTCLIVESVEEI